MGKKKGWLSRAWSTTTQFIKAYGTPIWFTLAILGAYHSYHKDTCEGLDTDTETCMAQEWGSSTVSNTIDTFHEWALTFTIGGFINGAWAVYSVFSEHRPTKPTEDSANHEAGKNGKQEKLRGSFYLTFRWLGGIFMSLGLVGVMGLVYWSSGDAHLPFAGAFLGCMFLGMTFLTASEWIKWKKWDNGDYKLNHSDPDQKPWPVFVLGLQSTLSTYMGFFLGVTYPWYLAGDGTQYELWNQNEFIAVCAVIVFVLFMTFDKWFKWTQKPFYCCERCYD